MFEIIPWWILLLVIPLALWVAFSLFVASMIKKATTGRLIPAKNRLAAKYLADVFEDDLIDKNWIAHQGFEPEGVFEGKGLPGIKAIMVWVKPDEATHLSLFYLQTDQVTTYLSTQFPNDIMVKTVDSADEHIVPSSPNTKLQTFSVKNEEELWQHHMAAVTKYQEHNRVRPNSESVPFSDLVIDSSIEHYRFLRTIPLWWLRIPAWMMFRKGKYHGKPLVDFDNYE